MLEIKSEDLVLVAIVKTPRDLDIARVLGWYRIPLATSPKTIRVDWLAFYQTSAFGDEKWSVRYIARVKGHELVTRKEILHEEPDHPRANEPYFKMQLGPIKTLPNVIYAKSWRRFTFLFTTGNRILSAVELKDLTVPASDEHDVLWKLLKERGLEFANAVEESNA
jgi:hypothetical protein